MTPAWAATAAAVSGLSPVSIAMSVDAERAQLGDRLAGAGAQRVADGDHAERAVLVADDDGGLALTLEPFD